jgi:hypothetical protein
MENQLQLIRDPNIHELLRYEDPRNNVYDYLYYHGDLLKPVPPYRGMILGHGTPKIYGEWLRMHLLVGQLGQTSEYSKSLKKRHNSTNSREYGWVCTDDLCTWHVHINKSQETGMWRIRSYDDHSEVCSSKANPTQREMMNLLRNSRWETHDMNQLMDNIEKYYGIPRGKATYRKLWNAKNALFGKRETVGSADPVIDDIANGPSYPIEKSVSNHERVISVINEEKDLMQLNSKNNVSRSSSNDKIMHKDLNVNDILYFSGNHCTPRRPFIGMNLGAGSPKVYGDWLRMCLLFDDNGLLTTNPKSIKKGQKTTNSKQYGWRCSDDNCTWKVDIVWRKKRNAWFIRNYCDHSANCSSTANISQSVIANILQSKSGIYCTTIADLMSTAESIGLNVEEKNYSKFWHAKNILLKRKGAPIVAPFEAKNSARIERAQKKRKTPVVDDRSINTNQHSSGELDQMAQSSLDDFPQLHEFQNQHSESFMQSSVLTHPEHGQSLFASMSPPRLRDTSGQEPILKYTTQTRHDSNNNNNSNMTDLSSESDLD